MNRKQHVGIWVAGLIVVVLLGLRTGQTYKFSEVMKPGGPETGHTALFLYGTHVLSSENAGSLHPLLNLGEYKYELIAAVVLLCGVFVLTARTNKQ